MLQDSFPSEDLTVDRLKFVQQEVVALLGSKNVIVAHPALSRIHSQVNSFSKAGVEAQITSYDRMHHRHNRS